MAGGEMVERLWACPECGVIVKATEVLPPLEMDAEKIIERKMLILQVKGLSNIMRRFRLGLPFFRLGCWLADMDLELQESHIEPEQPEIWRSHQSQQTWYAGAKPVIPATVEELDEELEYRRYVLLGDEADRLADLNEWYGEARQRLSAAHEKEASTEGGSASGAELVLGGPRRER